MNQELERQRPTLPPELAHIVFALLESAQIPEEKAKREQPEIERKFLVSSLPYNLANSPSTEIRQGYLQIIGDDEIRIRDESGVKTMTRKRGKGVRRSEREVLISDAQFAELWQLAQNFQVVKQRYSVPVDNGIVFVDVYQGPLQGLVVAESEFDTLEASQAFTPPSWCGAEVTYDKRFKNQSLAVDGVPLQRDPPEQVTHTEMFADHLLEEGVEDLIGRVEEKLDDREATNSRQPIFVMVAGRTSSGKTSAVTEKILSAFPDQVAVLSMDNYFIGNERMAALQKRGVEVNWDHPNYLDFELIQKHLHQLARGESIDVPIFSFKTGERDGSTSLQPKPIIIVEGLFALNSEVQDFADVSAFVDISLHGSLIRRLLRDVHRTTMNPLQILKYYLEVVEPMYQEHIKPTRNMADVVLVNEYHPRNEAGRSGTQEAQVKFAVPLTAENLRRAGAQRLGETTQVDAYFTPNDGELEDENEVVRIRQEGESYVLTYKGPQVGEAVRVRPTFEFVIDESTDALFRHRYGSQFTTIHKRRTLYQLGSVSITLDEVQKQKPGSKRWQPLGKFVELRGQFGENVEEQMREVAQKLGLNFDQAITTPYVQM